MILLKNAKKFNFENIFEAGGTPRTIRVRKKRNLI
jgi:hypothetical protein